MSGFFPSPPRNVHASPPNSPPHGSGRSLRPGETRSSAHHHDTSLRGPPPSSSRDRRERDDGSYYERRPKSVRDNEEDRSRTSPSRSGRYNYGANDDSILTENPEWVRKSSRQRRFTQSTFPNLHEREKIAKEEIDYDDSERKEDLERINMEMDDMSGYVANVVQRKEEDLKFMAEMFDEDGNPIPRYDEDGNPIPFRDEDGHSIDGWDRHEEDNRKANMVTIDTSKMAIREGWLWKKGSGVGIAGRRNWTRRYFKFDMFQVITIYYFRNQMPSVSEQHASETKEMYQKRKKAFFNAQKQYARGYVRLMYASLEIPGIRPHKNPNINSNWEFEIVIPNSRTFILAAENQEDFEKWTETISYITTTIQKARASLSRKRVPRSSFDEAKRDEALCCTAYGKGLFEAVAGHTAEFFVQGFDTQNGIPATFGGQRITAVLESRDLHYDLPVKDNGDGTYTVTYTPTRVGTYELSIMLDDYDIKGSPFHPSVRPAPVSAPHCVADGAGLYCAVVGAVNRFNIHTRNAFNQIVVARGVPFEVYVLPPLVLCNVDGSPIANPEDWRPHDNGNGTYAVAYTVTPSKELLERLNKGDHLEGEIVVSLDDRIHTPSFSRGIKNSPFRPVLAASATGAALASAARHAALLMGGDQYSEMVNSFMAQQISSSPNMDYYSGASSLYGGPSSEIRLPSAIGSGAFPTMSTTASAANVDVSNNGFNPSTMRRADQPPRLDTANLDVEESSHYVKESPVRTMAREASMRQQQQQQENRRYESDSFSRNQPSFTNESQYQSRYPEYLPVHQRRSQGGDVSYQSSSSSVRYVGDSNLSPEQREALDAEREQLLRLRKELKEGKQLVDEQVGRIAFASGSMMNRRRQEESFSRSVARPDLGDDDEPPPPPPPYGYGSSASSQAARGGGSGRSFSSAVPPTRSPPVAHASPAQAHGGRSTTGGSASFNASSSTIISPTNSSLDASVQALFNKHANALKRVYRHYSARASVYEEDSLGISGFVKCLMDFDVSPTFASKMEVREAYLKASGGNEQPGLSLHGFVEALANVALSALSKPMFASLYPTPASKIQVLLTMWGLGDMATFDNVLQKERYARGM